MSLGVGRGVAPIGFFFWGGRTSRLAATSDLKAVIFMICMQSRLLRIGILGTFQFRISS